MKSKNKMGYHSASGQRHDDELAILDRLGIHQERRVANGDTPRAYTGTLPRGQNYYVPPVSSHAQNGAIITYPGGKRSPSAQNNNKVAQAFRTFVCCFRNSGSPGRKEFLGLQTPSKAAARKRNTLPRNGKSHSNGSTPDRRPSMKSGLWPRRWFPQPRESQGRTLRPSQIARGHPSPILGVQSPKADKALLSPPHSMDARKNCLIVDLDETLVHSSFKPVPNPDFVVPVEIDGTMHSVYVIKRPYVDEFLKRIGEWFECVLFTASLAKYADPVANLLDRRGIFRTRLFREACVMRKGNYIKDLNRLGRDLKRVIILDNSPASYAYHPDNAIPVQSWFDDTRDTELVDLLPFLEKLSTVDNVYSLLRRTKDEIGSQKPRRTKTR